MPIVECEVPSSSILDRRAVQSAYSRDSYRAPLNRPHANMVDIFFAIFGHHPLWVKLLLVVRNRVASLCGLEAPLAAEMMSNEHKSSYDVGEKIGVWPIFALTETELIAGRDNKHLDFRLSVLRESDENFGSVTVSTICTVHNTAGRIYLLFIIPFHKWGVQRMLSQAIVARRL